MKAHELIAPCAAIALVWCGCTTIGAYQQVRRYEITLASMSQDDTTETAVTATTDAAGKSARLLSAFFGLDDGLPTLANETICDGAGGKDGMPVIFSHEIDVESMQAGDFKVTTESGKKGDIRCVTLAPADDHGELRTVLLAGQYGSAADQPVRVEIVGNLLSIDRAVNFKGASITPTRLEQGPVIVLAERLTSQHIALGKKATPLRWGGGSGCPVGTKQVVNVVWSGGVTKPGGDEVNDVERSRYKVRVTQADGAQVIVTPFALGDLEDGDNNHHLCLDVEGAATSVFFPKGHMTDPNGDLNPETTSSITPRD